MPYLAYLQLIRLPNTFTVVSDVVMGFLVAGAISGSLPTDKPLGFGLLLAASCLMYWAGMILNDVYDAKVDARERPQRPIPSGRISLSSATRAGYVCLILGIGLATVAGFLPLQRGELNDLPPWRSGALAVLLAVVIVGYDKWLKKTEFGPVAMGSCRFINILMSMSLGGAAPDAIEAALSFSPYHLIAAGGIGIYIMGVTVFARDEAEPQSHRGSLAAGLGVIVLGIVLLAVFADVVPEEFRNAQRAVSPSTGQLLFLLLGLTIVRRCVIALTNPTPRNVQLAVKHALFSMILLDAAICVQVAPLIYTLILVLLLVPTMTLGRWIYST